MKVGVGGRVKGKDVGLLEGDVDGDGGGSGEREIGGEERRPGLGTDLLLCAGKVYCRGNGTSSHVWHA